MDTTTARLVLHPLGLDEARRILARTPGPGDTWAHDYPFADELDVLPMFIAAFVEHGDPAPFGLYAIARRSDGLFVGGLGFFGPPADGVAELGFGLVESARGHGFAAEALAAAIRIAFANGASSVIADALVDNHASHATMRGAGMVETRRDDELAYFVTA
ncbi:GNAT family N-acetyltransferase [Conyzicola sp.]|uniref:GNAT family N-acetyltransferase n=1 Tax=Conyzicola sp. TaxID=1969404 RepID=UPI00398A30D5